MYFDCPECKQKEVMSDAGRLNHYKCDSCGRVFHREYLLGWWDATAEIAEAAQQPTTNASGH